MGRRHLNFKSFDEVNQDVERLRSSGYDQLGKWDLSMVCGHLADAVEGSMKGIPFKGPWWFRMFLGKVAWKKVKQIRRLRSGVPIPEQVKPKPGGEVSANMSRLRNVLETVKTFPGPFFPHPYFGQLSPDDWRDFHLIHSSHHLSFLIPK